MEDIHLDDDIDLCDVPNLCDQPSLNFSDIPFVDFTDTPPDQEQHNESTEEIDDDQNNSTVSELKALNKLSESFTGTSYFLHENSEIVTDSDNSDSLTSLLSKIVTKFFMCRTKQFIKSLKNNMDVEKAKAHRKKIQQKSEKVQLKKSKWSVEDMKQDNSEGKQVSHNIILGNLAKNPDYFNVYTIAKLRILLQAYSVTSKKSFKKDQLVQLLKQKLSSPNIHHMDCLEVFASPLPPSSTVSSVDSRGEKRKNDNVTP